ncbi:MAG: TetR/AcrR family transcriptional regulator [Bacteroidota bacterium]
MPEAIETKEKIIDAAREIFTQKGLAGARMKEIAEKAEINQALLHYHFKTKRALFDVVFQRQAFKMFGVIRSVVFSDKEPLEKIDDLVAGEHEAMKDFPTLPLFVLYESMQNPDLITEFTKDKPVPMMVQKFMGAFQEAIDEGKLRDVDPRHIMVNTMSMILYPMIARPLLKIMLNLDDARFDEFIEERSTLVAEFVRSALKPED